jgi:hypothetical protein
MDGVLVLHLVCVGVWAAAVVLDLCERAGLREDPRQPALIVRRRVLGLGLEAPAVAVVSLTGFVLLSRIELDLPHMAHAACAGVAVMASLLRTALAVGHGAHADGPTATDDYPALEGALTRVRLLAFAAAAVIGLATALWP